MNKIDGLKYHNSTCHNIAHGFVDASIRSLNNEADEYSENTDFEFRKFYKKITSDLFVLLEEHDCVTKNTEIYLHDKASILKTRLMASNKEYIEIAHSLGKIIRVKVGDQLLANIDEKGNDYDMFVDDYTDKTIKSSTVIANAKFDKMNNDIDSYIKEIVNDFKLDDKPYIKNLVKNMIKNAANDYIAVVIKYNSKMYDNFAAILRTAKVYLKSYSKSISDLAMVEMISKEGRNNFDELGVPKNKKTDINETLEKIDYKLI